MKLVWFFALIAVAVARPEDHYDQKFDQFDIDEVISNKRLLNSYCHCFIGDGKCTPEGNDMKKLMPEAVETSCAKCSDKQKVMIAKAINAIQQEMPAEFAILMKKNDPENKHQDELKEFLAKYSA